jgi:acetyl-CoA synthetase
MAAWDELLTTDEWASVPAPAAAALRAALAEMADATPTALWTHLTRSVLTPAVPFAIHQVLFDRIYDGWDGAGGTAPAWQPTAETVAASNIAALMAEVGCCSYAELHAWSVRERAAFWDRMIARLGIVFDVPPTCVLDPASTAAAPVWLPGARLNIVDSCLRPAEHRAPAIVQQRPGEPLQMVSVADLRVEVERFAAALQAADVGVGARIAIDMPMTIEAVTAYLGIIHAGCVVVSISDSFAPAEIAARLRITGATLIITQDVIRRGGRELPLYAKVQDAEAPPAVVIAAAASAPSLRAGDRMWADFLADAEPGVAAVPTTPDSPTNILFSSGTTGDPKAIPWSQTTPIKCAADAWLHHDIRRGDVVAWPTNLGWMMGPWLVYASLVNGATMALYDDAPAGPGFAKFVRDAGVTMLGLVPSMVSAWRSSGCTDGIDWSGIRAFSSTGECSNAEDMLYLMSRACYRPVIEYCGGTEIGGGYITGSVVQPAAPGTFSTPALGLDVAILDDAGAPAASGELFLVPPSIGLSENLLNHDHHAVYYADTPTGPDGGQLRRHGDQMEALGGGYFRSHGRADDTMNLGGIKVSSAEIERVVATVPGVREAAAIAVAPAGGGPAELVIYVVPAPTGPRPDDWRTALQAAIRGELNPLFKIAAAREIDALPRTASNKVMRRTLRADYTQGRN